MHKLESWKSSFLKTNLVRFIYRENLRTVPHAGQRQDVICVWNAPTRSSVTLQMVISVDGATAGMSDFAIAVDHIEYNCDDAPLR